MPSPPRRPDMALVLAALPISASAQTTAPRCTENGRYTFNRVDDDYLRLDLQIRAGVPLRNGKMGWSCHLVPDERTALEDEIAAVAGKDNAALERR